MTFLAEAEAEVEGGKKFGLRPNTEAEAEAEGDKVTLRHIGSNKCVIASWFAPFKCLFSLHLP